jgi:hypothetical protein
MSPYMTMSQYDIIPITPKALESDCKTQTCSDCLMFASPEYVYQSDDIKSIIL